MLRYRLLVLCLCCLLGTHALPIHANENEANATTAIVVNTSGTPITFDPQRMLGVNATMWIRNELDNPQLHARTRALGTALARMPAGSDSEDYGWLSCETGTNVPDAEPCGGPNIHYGRPTDIVNFLRATNRPGIFTLNMNSTAQEAAALVAFFNSRTTDTTMIGIDRRGRDWGTAGQWAQLRARNGNPEPINLLVYEYGNEPAGGTQASGGSSCTPWGWERVWTCDGGEYIRGSADHDGYRQFRAAMQRVDPRITLGAFATETLDGYNSFTAEAIAAGAREVDFYSLHHYGYFQPTVNSQFYPAASQLPSNFWPTTTQALRSEIARHAPGRAVPIWVNEYNLAIDHAPVGRQSFTALYLADTVGQIIANGYTGASHWNLADGGAHALLNSENNFVRSPQYYAVLLWSRFGNRMLPVTSGGTEGTLRVYAGRTSAGAETLLVINYASQAATRTLRFEANGQPITFARATVDTASAASQTDTTMRFNGVPDPNDDLSNAPASSLTITDENLSHTFPGTSVTLITLRRGAADMVPRMYLPTTQR